MRNVLRNDKHGTVALFGLPISNVTMDEAVGQIEEKISSGKTHQIATANLDFARNAMLDKRLHQIICECSMVLADGAPLVWASKMLGKPLRQRVTGVDLIPRLAELSARRGYGIYFLGSDEENSRLAAESLQASYPGLRIVGRYSPEMSTLDEMDNVEILERIRKAAPDILLVAFGNPKQELWIHANRARLDVPVSIGIGGSLEILAGSVARAPRWVQTLGMEWAFRLSQEPFRLMPRYFKDAVALLRHLPATVAVSQLQPTKTVAGQLMVSERGGVRFVTTPVDVYGHLCDALTQQAALASQIKQTMVVDFSATRRVEADALGALLAARRTLGSAGQRLCLVGMSRSVRRVVQFSELDQMLPPADPELMEITQSDTDQPHLAPVVAVEKHGSPMAQEAIAARSTVSA